MTQVEETLRQEAEEYQGDSDQPLGGYALTAAAYLGMVGAGLLVVRRRRDAGSGTTVGPWDLVLMSLATHKASRMVAKDPVASPLRAMFTRFRGVSAPAELAEEPRGEGGRRTVGELVACPFCLAQWVATGYAFGLVLAPRSTRSAGAVLSAVAVSDWLQLAYAKLQQAQD